MDIRNFFGAKGNPKPKGDTKVEQHKSSGGDKKKKRVNVISDSDSEEEVEKKPKVEAKKVTPKKETAKSKTKLKEVNKSEFFNSKTTTTASVKRKSPEKELKRDKAFEETLKEESFSPLKKARTKSPEEKKSLSAKLSKLKDEKKAPHESASSSHKLTPVKEKSKASADDATEQVIKTPESKSNVDLDDSTVIAGTPGADKESKRAAYLKYVARGGATNPGSKEVPEGTPGCFQGLVFVLTGVYESLEREEMTNIVKKLGGKVTTSLSKNTKYLVVGTEAGESKMAKAKTLGTPTLTEDEFLNLIREKSGKEKENTTPKASPEKVEDKKVKSEEKKSKVSSPKDKTKEKKTPVKEEKFKPEPSSSKVKLKDSPKKDIKPPPIKKIDPEEKKTLIASGPGSGSGETELLVEKYKPASCKGIIGQQGDRSNMNKLRNWLVDWNKNHLNTGGKKGASKPAPWGMANDNGAWAKCALLSGPPGVGKTTTSYLVAKELGYDVVEMNASDTRSKKLLGQSVADILDTASVGSMMGQGNQNNSVTSKRVLLMDEVDGMAGNEDRGGMAELINLIKASKVPVIAMCNDRNHQKIRSLSNYCFDLRFSRPRVEQIKAAMMSVCFKEKIPIKPDALSELISGCGQDVRQVLHHLSMIKASGVDGGPKMEAEQARKEAEMSKKTSIKVGPWDVCKKVFSEEDRKTMSFIDKSDLYFHDYNLSGLFVQENYLSSKPAAAGGKKKQTMELVSKAADSIAQGDLVDKAIRSGMNWSLLSSAAVFSSVLPGEYMAGFLTGQIQFPSWLGKNSKRNKTDRLCQELQMHTRLSAGLSKESVVLGQGQMLRNHILGPLVKEGAEGVDEAVKRMGDYNLLREDLDSLIEVGQWPDRPDPMKNVDSKTKAAFTRKYNKEGIALPYSIVQTVTKKKGGGDDLMPGEEDDNIEDDDDEDKDNIEKDAMIKMKKPAAKKGAVKDDSTSSKGKGKGKGKK